MKNEFNQHGLWQWFTQLALKLIANNNSDSVARNYPFNPSFSVDPGALSILQKLETAGFEEATLFGGALRDQYMGMADKISDYDIAVKPGTLDISNWEVARKNILDFITNAFPSAQITKEPHGWHSGELAQYNLEFMLDQKLISLHLSNIPFNRLEFWSQHADAPIDSIAADSTGCVRFHKYFAWHAATKCYQPKLDLREANKRFDKLRSKIPGLTYDMTHIPMPV